MEKEFKYSKEEFANYKFRAKIDIRTSEKYEHDVCIDIYTTNPDKYSFRKYIESKLTNDAISLDIIHWCTREQDDNTSIFLNELDLSK